jgi:hypothetical protein
MSIKSIAITLCAAGSLAACGETGTNQALLGGAAGAGIAVVADANPIKGAAIGAAGNFVYCQVNPGKCN